MRKPSRTFAFRVKLLRPAYRRRWMSRMSQSCCGRRRSEQNVWFLVARPFRWC